MSKQAAALFTWVSNAPAWAIPFDKNRKWVYPFGRYAAVAPVIGTGPENLRTALAQMAYLNDAALWQAARTTMTAEQRACLEALHDKQQREGLTAEEQAEEQALLTLYRETLLVRAQAAVLLKQRGYDVSFRPPWTRYTRQCETTLAYPTRTNSCKN